MTVITIWSTTSTAATSRAPAQDLAVEEGEVLGLEEVAEEVLDAVDHAGGVGDEPERDQRHHGDGHPADVEAHRDLEHRPQVDPVDRLAVATADLDLGHRRAVPRRASGAPAAGRWRARASTPISSPFPSGAGRSAVAGTDPGLRAGGRTAASGPMSSATLSIFGLRCPLRWRTRLRGREPRH